MGMQLFASTDALQLALQEELYIAIKSRQLLV